MNGLFIPGITAEMFRNGCLESIDALMADGEIYDIDYSPWIPITEDNLPREGEEVLVSLSENGVHGKKVEIDCFMRCDIKYWLSGKVRAWMPKPEPYEGG